MDVKTILEGALCNGEISSIEALVLLQQKEDISPQLFNVANILNQKTNKNIVSYTNSKYIHYTNICKARCKFCSFGRKSYEKGAFTLSPKEVLQEIKSLNGVKEIRLQGGLNPSLNLDYHISLISTIKKHLPNIFVTSYTPSEIYFIAKKAKITSYDVLRKLLEVGLDSISGDATDLLNDRIRKKFYSDTLRTNEWIDIVKTAHSLGMKTNTTLLCGHAGTEIHICEHLDIIKTIQKETNGFTGFTIIPFIPNNTRLPQSKISLDNIFKLYAVCRLLFNKTIRNIQIDLAKLGVKNAIKSLEVGVNDFGALSFDKYYIKSNGSKEFPVTTSSLKNEIRKVNKIPLEIDPFDYKNLRKKDSKASLVSKSIPEPSYSITSY